MSLYLSDFAFPIVARLKSKSADCMPALFYNESVKSLRLTVPHHRPELSRHEVVRRPWAANHHFAALHLCRGAIESILILLNRLVLNKMRNIDQHPARLVLTATDLRLQRSKHLPQLYRPSSRLG